MSLIFGIVLYVMIWFTTLFAVLPFGVRTQGEAGSVVPGTPESAPETPRLFRTFLINTGVATVAFFIVWQLLSYDWVGIENAASTVPVH